MKKLYIAASMLFLGLGASAQSHSTNFDSSIGESFLENDDVYTLNQHGSNFILFSGGHDEWKTAKYAFNDATSATPISISTSDTIYIRAKASFVSDVSPMILFGLEDENGVSADQYDLSQTITLSEDYQVFKISVSSWLRNGYGVDDPNAGATVDSTKIAYLTIGPNNGFASYPPTNGLGQTVNEAFVGSLYIDYISIGEDENAGAWVESTTSYEETFDTDLSSNFSGSDSYVVTADGSGDLSIVSAGHDEWDYVRFSIPNQVIDLTTDSLLEFTANAVADASYTGNIGVMVQAVDENGLRANYPGTLLKLTSESQTFQIVFDAFNSGANGLVGFNAERVAYLDVIVNFGFASATTVNDQGESLNTAFEGTITIESVKLGSAVVVNGISEEVKLLDVYPNPTNSLVNFSDFTEGGEYAIFDVNGQLVLSGNTSNESVDVSNLSAGVYSLTVAKENQLYATKLIVE